MMHPMDTTIRRKTNKAQWAAMVAEFDRRVAEQDRRAVDVHLREHMRREADRLLAEKTPK